VGNVLQKTPRRIVSFSPSKEFEGPTQARELCGSPDKINKGPPAASNVRSIIYKEVISSTRGDGNLPSNNGDVLSYAVNAGRGNGKVSEYLAGLYARPSEDGDSGSDNNDEEEGIGWSPFVIPAGN
jgi:hypothetical protein